MNLIDQVAQLRELEARVEPEWMRFDGKIYCKKSPDKYPLLMPYGINSAAPEIDLTIALRNAAPLLLEVLGAFQLGDAALISQADIALDSVRCIDDRETKIKHQVQSAIRRLAMAARRMEAREEEQR